MGKIIITTPNGTKTATTDKKYPHREYPERPPRSLPEKRKHHGKVNVSLHRKISVLRAICERSEGIERLVLLDTIDEMTDGFYWRAYQRGFLDAKIKSGDIFERRKELHHRGEKPE